MLSLKNHTLTQCWLTLVLCLWLTLAPEVGAAGLYSNGTVVHVTEIDQLNLLPSESSISVKNELPTVVTTTSSPSASASSSASLPPDKLKQISASNNTSSQPTTPKPIDSISKLQSQVIKAKKDDVWYTSESRWKTSSFGHKIQPSKADKIPQHDESDSIDDKIVASASVRVCQKNNPTECIGGSNEQSPSLLIKDWGETQESKKTDAQPRPKDRVPVQRATSKPNLAKEVKLKNFNQVIDKDSRFKSGHRNKLQQANNQELEPSFRRPTTMFKETTKEPKDEFEIRESIKDDSKSIRSNDEPLDVKDSISNDRVTKDYFEFFDDFKPSKLADKESNDRKSEEDSQDNGEAEQDEDVNKKQDEDSKEHKQDQQQETLDEEPKVMNKQQPEHRANKRVERQKKIVNEKKPIKKQPNKPEHHEEQPKEQPKEVEKPAEAPEDKAQVLEEAPKVAEKAEPEKHQQQPEHTEQHKPHIEVHQHKHFEQHHHLNVVKEEHPQVEHHHHEAEHEPYQHEPVEELSHHHHEPEHHEPEHHELDLHHHHEQQHEAPMEHHHELPMHQHHHELPMHHHHEQEHHLGHKVEYPHSLPMDHMHHPIPIKEEWIAPDVIEHQPYHNPLVFEDHSELHKHSSNLIHYHQEVVNHPHGTGLSPVGVRQLVGAFSTPTQSKQITGPNRDKVKANQQQQQAQKKPNNTPSNNSARDHRAHPVVHQ